ncbi:MAG: DUF2953 domain-containing protein [Acutalibacteraceae bacterium]
MIPLIIVLSVSAFIVLLLFIPISVHIKYDGDFFVKLKIAGIKAFGVEPKEDIKEPSPDTESDKKAKKQTEKAFDKLKKRHGFAGAVKEVFALIRAVLERLKRQSRHIAIRRLCLDIKVASGDAATTAIEYGAICAAVYPVLTFIDGIANVKMKSINVTADFNSDKPDFGFSVIIRARILFLIIMAFGAFSEYNKFKTRNEL